MTKKGKILALLSFVLLVSFSPLAAQTVDPARASLFKLSLIVGGAVITVAVVAGAFGQAKAITSACESISRNPAGGQNIRGILIFGDIPLFVGYDSADVWARRDCCSPRRRGCRWVR